MLTNRVYCLQTEVLTVLQDSIELIGRMKHDIANLVVFFKGLSILVESIVKSRVRKFVDHLQGDFSADEVLTSDPGSAIQISPTAKIGDFRLVDAERECLYRTVVTIRSFFSLFTDVSGMWISISVKHVKPGLTMIQELRGKVTIEPANNPAAMQGRVAELEAWSDAAVQDVEALVSKVSPFRFRFLFPSLRNRTCYQGCTDQHTFFHRDKRKSRTACSDVSTSTPPSRRSCLRRRL